MAEQLQPKRELQPMGTPTAIRLIGRSFARAVRDTARTLSGLFRRTILVTLAAGLLLIVLMGWILPLYGWPIPDDLWGQWPRTALSIGALFLVLIGPLFLYKLIQAPLLVRLDELVKPKLEVFLDDPDLPPFRETDTMNPGIEVRRIGARATTLATVHSVEVLVAERMPPAAISIVEPLQIQRESLPWGRDVRPEQPIYAQIILIGALPSPRSRFGTLARWALPRSPGTAVPSRTDGLPEVRVHYSHAWGARLFGPLPCGQWDLRIVAASEESPPVEAYVRLTVTDDRDPGKRATLGLIDKIGGKPLPKPAQ